MRFTPFRFLLLGAALVVFLTATVTGRAIWRWCSEKADQQTPIALHLKAAQTELQDNTARLEQAVWQQQVLRQKLAHLKCRREARVRQHAADREALASIRSKLAAPRGISLASTSPADSPQVDRAELLHQGQVCLVACQEHEKALHQFDIAIGALEAGIEENDRCIAQARAQLLKDRDRLSRLQAEYEAYRIRRLVGELVEQSSPEEILSQQRPFDRRLDAAAQRMAALGSGEMVGLPAPRAAGPGGPDQAAQQAQLLAEVDRYLNPKTEQEAEP